MPLVLRVRALWKSYAAGVAGCSARIWVLRGTSLDVHEGQCVALLGARGSGTTTLLHCLAGLRRPDAGTIERSLDARLLGLTAASLAVTDGGDELLLVDAGMESRDDRWPAVLRSTLGRRGAAIIATHDISRVRTIADRVVLLRDGRLTEIERTADVRRVAERRAGMRR